MGIKNLLRRRAVTFIACAAVLVPAAARAQSVAISSIYSGGPAAYTLTGTVTSVLDSYTTNNTFILTDATGSVLAYHVPLATYTATLGDNITLTGNDVTYQGSPELSSGYSVTVNTTGNAVPAAAALTIPQFNGAGSAGAGVPPYAEALVALSNVYFPAGTTSLVNKTAYTLSDLPAGAGNTTTLYTYSTYSNVAATVTNANALGALLSGPVNIVGYADVFNGKPELYPTSITSAVTNAPEPSTCAIFGVGLVAMACAARRRGPIPFLQR